MVGTQRYNRSAATGAESKPLMLIILVFGRCYDMAGKEYDKRFCRYCLSDYMIENGSVDSYDSRSSRSDDNCQKQVSSIYGEVWNEL